MGLNDQNNRELNIAQKQNENGNVNHEIAENLAQLGKLKVSEFVRIIDKGEDTVIIYHTLFGMPTLVSRDILSLFEAMKQGNMEELGVDDSELQEFRDNFFLVDQDVEERVVHGDILNDYKKTAVQGKEIIGLDLLISEACNFGCTHCIYFNSMESGDHNRANKLMTFDQAKGIIADYTKIMVDNNNNVLDIHFGAAEPLLNWKNLTEIVLHVKETYPQYTHKFAINTNLSLLDEDKALFMKEHGVEIHVSLDGNKEANDAIRTTRKGAGTFDLIMSKIALLEAIGYPITGVSLTITSKNYHLVDVDFVHFCKEMGLSNLAFDIDLLGAIELDGVTVEEISHKMVKIYKEAEKLGIEAYGTWTSPFQNIMEKSVLTGEIPYFCSAVKGKNLAVSRDGEATTCSYTTTKVGNIHDIKFGEDSELGKLISSRTPGVSDYCKGCEIEGHCAGQCHVTKELAKAESNPAIISTMCDYYRTTTRLLLENVLEHNGVDKAPNIL